MNDYLEFLFLLNGITDALMLWLTASIRRAQYKVWRLIISAATGGLFAVWMALSPLPVWWQAACVKMVCASLMVALTFGLRPLAAFVRNCAVFFMIAFVVAGFIFATKGMFGVQSASHPLWFVCGLLGGSLFCLLVLRSLRTRRKVEEMTAHLTVRLGEFSFRCRALVDTGNHLLDPISRAPVTVMQFVQWQPFLPPGCIDAASPPSWEQWVVQAEQAQWAWRDRIRVIPFSTLGVEQSLLFALRVDDIYVEWNDRTYVRSQALVGIVPQTLSRSGDYQAIIHPSIVTGAD